MYLCTEIVDIQQDMEEKKYLTVKDWANEDKPREKMLLRGKKELSNAELIAILLRSGLPGKSAVDVAKEVLNLTANKLTALSQLDYRRLANVKGLGQAKATTLLAALELGWRMQGEINDSKELIINDSSSLFDYMKPLLADLDHEEFWAVYLTNRNKVIARQRIASGGQTETSVDPRIVFRGALECKAVKIAVLHNHPSGSLTPSKNDKRLTERLYEGGRLLEISVTEHIIVAIGPNGRPDYYSFHDNGLL
jgi:DNA repair protein RadC